MDGVEPRGVDATRVVLAGVLVCSAAPLQAWFHINYILIRFVISRLAYPHICTCLAQAVV